MNPLRRLEADHRAIEAHFDRVQRAEAGEPRRAAYAALREALLAHAALEERVFYAAVRASSDVLAQEIVSLALDEHEDVRAMLAEIDAADPASDAFAVRCDLLAAEVARHVAMEEDDLFRRASRLLGAERLAAVGARLETNPVSRPPTRSEPLRRPA